MESHPLRMRGLKPKTEERRHISQKVASFTDAWIETKKEGEVKSLDLSHPLRMRGLKLKKKAKLSLWTWSHPLRMRGLKHTKDVDNQKQSCRILYGCVD